MKEPKMDRKDLRRNDSPSADDLRCILCEGVIEITEHEVFFATGRCRFCHEELESEEEMRAK